MEAAAYRITLKPRRETDDRGRKLTPRNFGNEGHKGKGLPEKFWSAADVEALIPQLRRENARGYDIYITPIDDQNHYLVIDDMTRENVKKMKAEGIRPCVLQRSSENNYQAIIKAPKFPRYDEQSIANKLTQEMNLAWGDPKFSGAVHPFRMAGFSNKKPGKENAFTYVIETYNEYCDRTTAVLRKMRNDADEAETRKFKMRVREIRKRQMREYEVLTKVRQGLIPPIINDLNLTKDDPRYKGYQEYAEVTYISRYEFIESWAGSKGLNIDPSRCDFYAVKSMLLIGWPSDEVERCILECSPDINKRHHNPTDYARRTVEKSLAEVEEMFEAMIKYEINVDAILNKEMAERLAKRRAAKKEKPEPKENLGMEM